jgi:hypothetical protein
MSRVVSAPPKVATPVRPVQTPPPAATAKAPVIHQDQIAKRAYEKWLKHRQDGKHVQDWLEAEAELKRDMQRR